MEKVKLNTIEEAIEDFKAGNFVIVVDDEDRENEGDLIIAALQRAGFTSSGDGQYLGIGYSFYGDCR